MSENSVEKEQAPTVDIARESARQLGIACRFRGLEYVKKLVESGSTFSYTAQFPETQSTWEYNYSLALLEHNSATKACYRINYHDVLFSDEAKFTSNDGRSLESMRMLPIEKRAEIAEYLCENSERAGFDMGETLFYSIMSGSHKITAVLKKHGAKFSEDRIADLSENGRSFNWLEFAGMMENLSDAEFLPVLRELAAEMDGVKFHFTNGVFEGNYIEHKKKYRFFDIDIFKFYLENFNQKKMCKGRIMKTAIDLNRIDCLEVCVEHGWLAQPRKRDEIITYANEIGKTECTAWLLEFKNRTADLAAERERAEKRMMQRLNADPNSVSELKKIWSFEKLEDGGLVIKRYKGKKTEIEVPEKIGKDTVTVIGEYAFSPYAPRLTRERGQFLNTVTKITLPNTIKIIGDGAFYSLTKLEEVNIPDGVTRIGEKAFSCCYHLPKLDIPAEEIVIPDSVNEIGNTAFSSCQNLEYVTLPSGLTEIPDYLFSNCQHLKRVNIPASVKRIGIWAFRLCKELEEIVLPEGVEEIAREAFVECDKLKTVVLPESIKMIKNYRSPPETPFHKSPNVTAVVVPKSYAEKYCKRNNIPFVYNED